jgi:ribosomal protein L7Ae-like RNA K-turn-binding protein
MACNITSSFFSLQKELMDDQKRIEEFIKASPKVVGTKQVLRSIAADDLKCAVISEDADDELKFKIRQCATERGLEVLSVPSKERLGQLVEIDVCAAVVGILKRG